ncbi:MAG: DUF6090 family protein [Flavobacteriales bacterium]
MIKFFRKIRQQLLSENKFSKYLIYALGEIVLVVIGILIAMQINNWNEQRKVDIEIGKVLKEVRNDLITDSIQIKGTHAYKIEDIRIQYTVIEALESGTIPYDSLEYHLGRVMLPRRLVLVDKGYQLLKKFGLERIKDEALRNELTTYYNVSVHRINEDTEDDDHEFIEVFMPYVRHHFLDWNWTVRGVPADYEHLKTDQYFRSCLKVNVKNQESTVQQLEKGAKKIQEILPLLDKAILAYD